MTGKFRFVWHNQLLIYYNFIHIALENTWLITIYDVVVIISLVVLLLKYAVIKLLGIHKKVLIFTLLEFFYALAAKATLYAPVPVVK